MFRNMIMVAIAISIPSYAFAQTATMNSTGSWATSGNWASSNIGDAVSETITVSNNINPTVASAGNFTVGSTTLANNNTLTVDGILNIGNAANSRTLTTNNNAVIAVSGTLIIWGDVQVNNNIVWNISGTVIIKGNLVLSNNATVNVSGNLGVNGDLTAGNNTNFAVAGTVTVGGNTNVGNGSNLNGCAGCYHSGGTCTGPASFCGSGTLPVTLLYLKIKASDDAVSLDWATATEENTQKFVVQRSSDGAAFEDIGEVPAAGNSFVKLNYAWSDSYPLIGYNYYRLKMIDLDGKTEYSPVRSVDHTGAKGIVVYPNPTSGQSITLIANFEITSDATVQIFDNVGIKRMETQIETDGSITFNNALIPGHYILKYSSAADVHIIRFTVKN